MTPGDTRLRRRRLSLGWFQKTTRSVEDGIPTPERGNECQPAHAAVRRCTHTRVHARHGRRLPGRAAPRKMSIFPTWRRPRCTLFGCSGRVRQAPASRKGSAWHTGPWRLLLLCGGILRSVWIEDMEWKEDERWSYQMSQEVGRTRPWPAVGMPTSLKFPNPGLSVWIFVPIGRLVSTPTSMARAIVLLNMVALIGFAAAVRAYLPRGEREPWLWGLALQAVSPFAIRMSRKIWPPSLLTLFLLLLWVSHRHRDVRRAPSRGGLSAP